MKRPNDLIPSKEARAILGIGTHKMQQLLDDGALETFSDPLDKRVRLVSERDVRALLAQSRKAA